MNVSIIGHNCTGCHACEQSCPVNAISFSENHEGFYYPKISDTCIDCGECLRKCHSNSDCCFQPSIYGYAAYIKDSVLLRKSSSGGVFAVIAAEFIKKGGVVFGCTEDKPGNVHHIAIENVEDIPLLQGSKYVESDLDGTYSQVESYIKKGTAVLFSGTPCQIAGVKSYIGRNTDLLFTLDIVCHGVPSRKIYQEYLSWESKRQKKQISTFVFRSKEKHGWSLTYRMELTDTKGTSVKEHMATMSPYYYHFLQGYNYRESCYHCKYARKERCSDITLCDFWGIESVAPEMNNYNGVSGVLVNNVKGEQLWKSVQSQMISKQVDVMNIINNNGQLRAPSIKPQIRDQYYLNANTYGYDWVVHNYSPGKLLVVDTIKDFFPNRYRQTIKQLIRSLTKRRE